MPETITKPRRRGHRDLQKGRKRLSKKPVRIEKPERPLPDLGRARNASTYFPDGPQGRCPICGFRVVLPCLACGLDELTDFYEEPVELDNLDELEETLEIQLFGKELQRYLQIRKRREELSRKGLDLKNETDLN